MGMAARRKSNKKLRGFEASARYLQQSDLHALFPDDSGVAILSAIRWRGSVG